MADVDVKRLRADQDEGAAPAPKPPSFNVQEAMPMYYAKLFPCQLMCKWLAYGNDGKHAQADSHFLARREFCFTLPGDIFVRYQSFKDAAALSEALARKAPAKIDIGPVYTACPTDRHKFAATFAPVERELVFDIDLTDYDDVRTCGSGGHICARCWPLMAVAVKILDAGLRAEFGFRHILWVYSGRRGVHCWVCDASARQLTDEQRSAVANWFGVYKGHEDGRPKLGLAGSTLHPAVERAAGILRDAWVKTLLPAQRLLEDGPTADAVLRMLPEEALAEAVRRKWAAAARSGTAAKTGMDVSVMRWGMLEEEVRARLAEERSRSKGGGNFRALSALERCCDDIVLAHAYPRLDMEVSKKMNHLLKAPFCVHPSTGKVCVPLDPGAVDGFDPDAVPTLPSLAAELRADAEARAEAAREAAAADQPPPPPPSEPWRATRMAEAVALFERVLLDGLASANREEMAARTRVAVAVGQMGTDF